MTRPRSAAQQPSMENRAKQILIGGEGQGAPEQVDREYELALTVDQTIEEREQEIVQEEQVQPDPRPEPQPDAPPELAPTPDKFANKTPEELIEMYQNLEKQTGKHANEIGEYRKFFDEFILKQTAAPAQPQTRPEDLSKQNDELLDMMLNRPSEFIKQIKQQTLEEFQGRSKLQQVHDLQQQNKDLLLNPTFRTWVAQNIPPALAVAADNDPVHLESVLKLYKTVSSSSTSSSAPAQPVRPSSVVAKPVGPAAGMSVHKQDGKKIWTRNEIRQLYRDNPEEYSARQDEIASAYQEGRVKNY